MLFESLNNDSLYFPKTLIATSRKREVAINEVLFQPNKKVDSLFYILKGSYLHFCYQLDGKPAVMMRSFAGEIFAPASMNMPCYPCSGISGKASTVLQIPKSSFIEHLESFPDSLSK